MTTKRFIEESFPVKEVSIESAKEKNIRHGHISTLHIWWSRKPLGSSRATTYAALIPSSENEDEWNKTRNFIINLCKWENSLDKTLLEKARTDILKANNGIPPKVLDPFGGGGSIPLEALRLGCETYSNDYNPVAVLIQKCTLEYPQKYGKSKNIIKDNMMLETLNNSLLEDVKKWGNWVLEEAKEEIGKFYPNEPDGFIPVGYYWMRTIPCQNPSCSANIPLTANFWLAKKDKKKVSLYPYVDHSSTGILPVVKFKIIGDNYDPMPEDFDPENGTVARANARCLVCGSMVDDKTTRKLFQEGKAGQRMIAVVLHKPKTSGKKYRIATEQDMEVFNEAGEYLKIKREKLMNEWGIDPVPDEELPPKETLGFRVQRYGMLKWGDLFNSRQKLALITFTEKVRQAHQLMVGQMSRLTMTNKQPVGQPSSVDNKMMTSRSTVSVDNKMMTSETKNKTNEDVCPTNDFNDPEYAKAVVSYLAIGIDRLASYCSSLGYWHVSGEKASPAMQRQALAMVFDYFETIPISEYFGWLSNIDWITLIIAHCSQIPNSQSLLPQISQSSATALPHSDNFFDAVFTDPPYYDNVPYSYLSDFFYVWLKRSIGDLYPELFSTPLTPKKSEIVAYSHGEGGFDAGKKFFEDMLKKSFQEIHRVLKPNGIAVIVYAHKSTEGWETLINSLLDSGLIMTGAWPLHTEMQSRLRAQESAALASSIYIVCRKMKREPTGFYNEVKEELKRHLNKKLQRLWEEGIGGADFFISAIGSAIEIFGKYEKVMDYEGNIIRADRLLEDVRTISTDYAVRKILHNGFVSEISDLTRFYVLYRWNYGDSKVIFDEARKLAQSCSIDLAVEWNKRGFIKKEKEFVRVLGPHERNLEKGIRDWGLGIREGSPQPPIPNAQLLTPTSDLIDVLHYVLLLWEKSQKEEMIKLLKDSGYGKSEAFYRVAQAISETLDIDNKEKKLLDGFLAGRERIKNEMQKQVSQESFLEN